MSLEHQIPKGEAVKEFVDRTRRETMEYVDQKKDAMTLSMSYVEQRMVDLGTELIGMMEKGFQEMKSNMSEEKFSIYTKVHEIKTMIDGQTGALNR